MESNLQVANQIGFPKTKPATPEAAMSAVTSRHCRWRVARETGGFKGRGAKERAICNASA